MIILRLLLLLTNLHLKLLSTQGTGADKLLSTQRVKHFEKKKKFFFFLLPGTPRGAAVGCVSAIRVHSGAALQGLKCSNFIKM